MIIFEYAGIHHTSSSIPVKLINRFASPTFFASRFDLRLDKGIEVEKAGRILHNLKAAGIPTFVYVLFGTPPETDVEARETLDFVRHHGDAITCLNTALFLLPRNSPLTDDLETADFSEGDLSLYTAFTHPEGWDRRALRHFMDRIWKRDPAVASILRRTPRIFTSNHAPFFS